MHARLALPLLFATAVAAARPIPPEPPPEACATVVACEARMRALAEARAPNRLGITREETSLIARMAAMPGAGARLVELLADPQPHVAELAGATLRDTKVIDPAWLPAITAAMDAGDGWIAPALARIPGDEAARLTVAYFLASDSAPHNQEAYAVRLLGPRAVPHLIAAARCDGGCAPDTHVLLAAVMPDDPESIAAAAPELLSIAADPARSEATAIGSLRMIAALGPGAAELGPELVALRAKRPALAPAIDVALVELQVPEGAEVIAQRLAGPEIDAWDLVAIAKMGAGGRSVAPAVLRLLDHANPELRISAATTLGYLDYPAAIPALRRALLDPRDVRLALAAATSLGLLHAEDARAELTTLAARHWYPPVRAAAGQALLTMDAGQPPVIPSGPGERQRWEWAITGAESGSARIESCARTNLTFAAADPNVAPRADVPEHRAALEALTFDSVVLSYGAGDEEEQREAAKAVGKEHPVIVVNERNMVEHRRPIRQTPTTALRVPGGWLAGSNRGEWGGELMYLADDGAAPVKVLDDNVHSLFALGRRFVAVTGLAHLSLNGGAVLELARDAEGRWQATPWRILPAAPRMARQLTSGEILIDTYGGGTLVLAADGALRMAPCADVGEATDAD